MTSLQPDASAQAPWTSTTVGFAAPERDADPAWVDGVSNKSAAKPTRAARAVSQIAVRAERLAARVSMGRTPSSGRRDRREHAGQPAVDVRGDLLPAVGRHEQVRPALELDVVGPCRRALVLLVLLLGERSRDRVVRGRADDEQRRALVVLEVDLA